MRTRKELCNDIVRMQAQLDVHQHVTRVALGARVKSAEEQAKTLERERDAARMELTNVQGQRDMMRAELQRLAATEKEA
jgi:hypothetical protein